jgi:hypothetical protein
MPFSPIVSVSDLNTHIYNEQLDEITRDDGGLIAGKAINAAFDEVKAYLSRFDRDALFGNAALDTAATVSDEFLKNLIKDIAVWHIIRLGNPSIHYDHAKWCYEAALDSLTTILHGSLTPPSWPLADTTTDALPAGDAVRSISVPMRNNYF